MRLHDREDRVRRALDEAERRAAGNKANFTPVRRHALKILLENRTAMSAYGLLKRLAADWFGSQPPVAYRALDFLMKQGFVHKLERLNAFVACAYPDKPHEPAFLVCRKCRAVAETREAPPPRLLARDARALGFRIERAVVEAEGLCRDCAPEDGAPCG